MIIGVQNIVTSKHATYLEFPLLGFEPRTGSWPLTNVGSSQKTSPGGRITLISQQRTSQMMRWAPPGFKPKSAVCVCLGGLELVKN